MKKKSATTLQLAQNIAEPIIHASTRQAKQLEQSIRKRVNAVYYDQKLWLIKKLNYQSIIICK